MRATPKWKCETNSFFFDLTEASSVADEKSLAKMMTASSEIRVGTLLAQTFLDFWHNNEDTRLLTEARAIYRRMREIDHRITLDIRPNMVPFMNLRVSILNMAAQILTAQSPLLLNLFISIEHLWHPLKMRFSFLPLPSEALVSNGIMDSYIAQEQYSDESVQIVQVKVHRQFIIAKEWLKQFAGLIGPKQVTGVPAANFGRLSSDITAAMAAFDDEMKRYIAVNSEFAADCHDAIEDFKSAWGDTSSPSSKQRTNYNPLTQLIYSYSRGHSEPKICLPTSGGVLQIAAD